MKTFSVRGVDADGRALAKVFACTLLHPKRRVFIYNTLSYYAVLHAWRTCERSTANTHPHTASIWRAVLERNDFRSRQPRELSY